MTRPPPTRPRSPVSTHSDNTDGSAEAELAALRAQVALLEAERAALWWAVSHDDLTGLANRRFLHAMGPALLRETGRCAVAVLDLNGFKPINDRYGHAVGDTVLRTVARRLSRCVGDDLAVRLSGDEFAAVLTESSLALTHGDETGQEWSILVTAMSDEIARPIHVGGETLTVTASIGVATAEGEPPLIGELIRRADLAMYRAKADRRRSHVVWNTRS